VAQALSADANNYRASSWRSHRRSTTCPPEIEGTAQGLLWRAFKAAPRFPTGWRQIWNIIKCE
jgi:hypothetical protein